MGLTQDGLTAVDVSERQISKERCPGRPLLPILKMLVTAPVDRVWRRRGWLVMCQTFPERVRPEPSILQAHEGTEVATKQVGVLKSARTGPGG